jgi:hypothetical protein
MADGSGSDANLLLLKMISGAPELATLGAALAIVEVATHKKTASDAEACRPDTER